MSVFDYARIIIYRFHEKGLEVLLINNEFENDPNIWLLPSGRLETQIKKKIKSIIELDDTINEKGEQIKTIAVEADWHEIPSVRGLIKHDVKRVSNKIIKLEQGTYFHMKEAFKKVLPKEYRVLKELKDVLFEKNTLTNI